VGDCALNAPGEASVQIVLRRERPMQILVEPRRLCEAAVVVSHKSREQGVASLDSVRAGQAQLL
jgi:hypothetical protein